MNNNTGLDHLQGRFGGKAGYIIYWLTMLLILTAGSCGNVLTLVICRRAEHRKKEITPLIINIAVADLIIVAFGYSVTFTANTHGTYINEGTPLCNWSALVNGTVGIGSLLSMVVINLLIYRTTRTKNVLPRLSSRKIITVIVLIWVYAVALIFPPLFGWNRIVLAEAMASCEPNFVDHSHGALSYNIYLMVFGYVIPLVVIGTTFYRIHRNLSTTSPNRLNTFKHRAHLEIVRMMVGVTIAFTLSWTPYAIMCSVAMVMGRRVVGPLAAELPALMAKSSVIYNPIVYVVMSKRFRNSLVKVISQVLNVIKRRRRVQPAAGGVIQINVAPSQNKLNTLKKPESSDPPVNKP